MANTDEHECEVLGPGPETAECAHAWQTCTKNPGHAQFIPAPEFSLEHLPEGAQDESVLRIVKNISARTVRLRVGYTSWARPNGYALSNHRGSSNVHTGTGYIRRVACVKNSDSDRCSDSTGGKWRSPHHKEYWVSVATACHVVYNDEEAIRTMVSLFYDDENAEEDGRVKALWALGVDLEDSDKDKCTLICATYDEDMARQLSAYTEHINMLYTPSMTEMWDDLCVIASHPHGQPKKISVGRLEGNSVLRLFYNTATCPGSSGAIVVSTYKPRSYWRMAAHSLGGQGGRPNSSGEVLFMKPLSELCNLP